MDSTILTVPPGGETALAPVVVASLYEAQQKLPDPRRGQGKRYSLAPWLFFSSEDTSSETLFPGLRATSSNAYLEWDEALPFEQEPAF